MDFTTLSGIGLGLSMDAFAVSVANGFMIKELRFKHALRMALSFGLFQALMPLLGWAAGLTFSAFISTFDHWLAFGLLASVGGKMLWESLRPLADGCGEQEPKNCSQLPILLLMSVATSIDALAVGLSLAFIDVTIWLPSVVIGVVACVFSAVGITFANKVLGRFGHLAEVMGGLTLIVIGIRIFIQHTF